MRTLPITVAADADYPLPGLLTLPDGAGPFPAVLLVHGSGPQDRDEAVGPNRPFRDLAVGLAALGVASLRPTSAPLPTGSGWPTPFRAASAWRRRSSGTPCAPPPCCGQNP